MNKILIISIGAVIVIGFFVLAYQLTGPPRAQTPTSGPAAGQNAGLPVVNSVMQNIATTTVTSGFAQGTVMTVAGASGETIQTVNFINDPATVKDPINSSYYYLGYHVSESVPDPTANDNPPYTITYISETQYFNIALLQEPIGTVRKDAQQYLMAHLGISQDQMCRLNYMVSVPNRVNFQFSGRNLGFSFCPGATPLPK